MDNAKKITTQSHMNNAVVTPPAASTLPRAARRARTRTRRRVFVLLARDRPPGAGVRSSSPPRLLTPLRPPH